MSYKVSHEVSSMLQVIFSWRILDVIRSHDSFPEALNRESVDALTRAFDLTQLTVEEEWNEVGRVANDDYFESLLGRIGFDVDGERASSPEIGDEHRF